MVDGYSIFCILCELHYSTLRTQTNDAESFEDMDKVITSKLLEPDRSQLKHILMGYSTWNLVQLKCSAGSSLGGHYHRPVCICPNISLMYSLAFQEQSELYSGDLE